MNDARAFQNILVVGGGAWGTALATLTVSAGAKTCIWARNKSVVDAINQTHENSLYLAGYDLPESLTATTDLKAAAQKCDAVLFVAPAQTAREVLANLRELTDRAALPVCLCCKGIERSTQKLMTEVLSQVWPEADPAILSGPSFAVDVVRGLPTAVTLACDNDTGPRWLATLNTGRFRPYLSQDMIGAELGGAVKNVIAIACGIVEGQGFGESARAALIARGFAEFQRLGVAMGADPRSMAGLSGLGDMILTCSSRQSRNMSLGVAIGEGGSAAEILSERHTVSEGAASAAPLVALAKSHGVEMPISTAVAAIIDGKIDVASAINALMSRPLRKETE